MKRRVFLPPKNNLHCNKDVKDGKNTEVESILIVPSSLIAVTVASAPDGSIAESQSWIIKEVNGWLVPRDTTFFVA